MKSKKPFIIQEPLLSPGCTRAVKTTASSQLPLEGGPGWVRWWWAGRRCFLLGSYIKSGVCRTEICGLFATDRRSVASQCTCMGRSVQRSKCPGRMETERSMWDSERAAVRHSCCSCSTWFHFLLSSSQCCVCFCWHPAGSTWAASSLQYRGS